MDDFDDFDDTLEESPNVKVERSPPPSPKATNNATKKKPAKQAIEEIYQKKTQLEHILLRPDSYIGSVERETKPMWVWDETEDGNGKMDFREISYVPGLYKIFDEILVNAADNKQRDKKMNSLRIEINAEENKITIYNNGKGIPVTEHKEEKLYVPTMIFGHLLTSSNYDDNEKKVVGGRNGYGAKLCNIFSTQFKVETSCKEYRKSFSQVWTDNMTNAEEPVVSPAIGDDFTRVTFQPDLARFKMDKLDKDIIALFSRRAFDVAASSKGVKVFLNGNRLPVSCFKDYINLFIEGKEDEAGNPLKLAHEVVNDRWEIAATVSDRGFQQISFVNSIATTRGGKHVDYIAEQIVAKVIEIIKKKNKEGVNVKPFQIKNHLWVFVNCLIENPTFDSQTKETMTLVSKSFGSKCTPSDKFFTAVTKVGAVESIMSWIKFKAESELAKKSAGKKHSKLTGMAKLEDANDAGTKNSIDCTLILTEGDSAKTLVVAGLSVLGRDKYGVFPLRGKMLNVREATHKQIVENAEINNIIKIVGLKYKKKYETQEDLKSLRYGRIMIMTDQDQDGSHIKGLLINFIHHNWPSLLKLGFLEEFITPIVKARKGDEEISFYSLPEFEEWKKGMPNWNSYKIKYYKGLGTSTSDEAKEYFSDMNRHRIKFTYNGAEDDHYVQLAFSKKMVDQRKDWLTSSLEERKRRRELGLPEMYLYEKNTRQISYKDFVNKELVLFSNTDNERSIPSLVDGLKPGQRKVVFTCFKRNDKNEVKVSQLAGSVGELSAYHHGEASLSSTIINLAHNFVGSNNINLLQPIGQFGTRLQGGNDSASPRYINTKLSPIARKLFPPSDDPLLKWLYDDNIRIEPEYYVPIIPMVLVNGAEGIGTGWSTKVPNYNPREITENIRRMIRGEEIKPMKPWYKGFTGTIVQVDPQKFVVNGEAAVLSETSFEITELPVRTWTQTYKEKILEGFLTGNNDRTTACITDYKEYHSDTTVRFLISMTEDNLRKALADGLHKTFKLQNTISNTSMVLFDGNGCMKKYETPEEIMREFFSIRLQFYVKRKAYCEGLLEAEVQLLTNQARFIIEKNDGTLVMENIDKKTFYKRLIERKFDSDPVKAWKKKYALKETLEEEAAAADEAGSGDETEAGSGDEAETGQDNMAYDFDYLYDMRMGSMLRENAAECLKKVENKKMELEELRRLTPQQLWERDLVAFLAVLDKVEKVDQDEAKRKLKKEMNEIKTTKGAKKEKPKPSDYKPSPDGERIEPKIDMEKYQPKKEKKERKKKDKENVADNKPEKKTKPTKEEEKEDSSHLSAADEDDTTMANTSDDDEVKLIKTAKKKPTKLKQTTLNFGKRPPVTDAAASMPAKRKPAPKKKAAPVKVADKRKSSDFEDDDEEAFAKKPTKKIKKTNVIESDSESAESDIQTVASSQSSTTGRPARAVRQRKPVNYKAALDSESELSGGEPSEHSTIEDDDDSDDIYEFKIPTKKAKKKAKF